MKIFALLALGSIVVLILVSGCETTTDTGPSTTPTNTFAPFHLRQGQITIYVGGVTGEFPVTLDNTPVGVTSTNRPLTLMADEGIRTVEVCCGVSCARENVTIRFGKPRTIDFSEQLEEDCKFSEPGVRILDYFLSSDQITITVELLNPTIRTVTISAEIRCWYTYIESGSNNRVGNYAAGQVFSTLKPGDRVTQILRLNVAEGSNYQYEIPAISQVSVKEF